MHANLAILAHGSMDFLSESYAAPITELDVLDRVGGGDGFAAGLFYGLLEGLPPDEAVRLGWAHEALVTVATLEQVRPPARGGSARIQP